MSSKSQAETKERHVWRENIEALAMAVVVALLFKSFILEISKIPSGSMQPTLMGNPETKVFDRVLVDKLSFHMRDPERFEIVVFKHPLERSRIMVKRLVGMPGEELRVAHGDLWTRPDSEAEWTILRRPDPVQEETWRRLDLKKPVRSSWSVLEGARDWSINGRAIEARGDGRVGFRADRGAIRDHYVDGYPDGLRGQVAVRNPQWGRNHVGDLRFEGRVRADEGARSLTLELTEGTRSYRFEVPGPAAAQSERPSIRARNSAEPAAEDDTASVNAYRLPAGRWVRFTAENLDDRLTLEIDDEVLVTREIPSARGVRGASVSLELAGSGAELEDLQVWRDIYYLPHRGPTWSTAIPEGHYVMLGDNTQDSADSRDWEVVRFEFGGADGELSVRGNFRKGGENPSFGLADDGRAATRFRDEWGEKHWFPREEGRQGLQASAPLVPRELIQGRAVAVFWPIKPHRGLWRLSWLH